MAPCKIEGESYVAKTLEKGELFSEPGGEKISREELMKTVIGEAYNSACIKGNASDVSFGLMNKVLGQKIDGWEYSFEFEHKDHRIVNFIAKRKKDRLFSRWEVLREDTFSPCKN